MDSTASAVNYLPPISNDYYDHHSFHSIQSLGNGSYYQSDTIDCLYNHQGKNEFQSATPYPYPFTQQNSSQTYGMPNFDASPQQQFAQESNLIALQNSVSFPSQYDLSCHHTIATVPIQNRLTQGSINMKQEAEDINQFPETNKVNNVKNPVFEWMKG